MRFTRRSYRRLLGPWAAGLLLQVGGCGSDLTDVSSELLTSITTSVLGSFVFHSFNLI